MSKKFRSSVTGKFVSDEEARANPRETYQDSIQKSVRAYALISPDGKILPDYVGATIQALEAYVDIEAGERVVGVRIVVSEED